MIDIGANYAAVRALVEQAAARAGRDAARVRVVAVSKRHPVEVIEAAFAAGVRDVGENFAQELIAKRDRARCGDELRWHFIGRLQRNKAKLVVGQVDLIHAVDSERLLREIERRAAEAGLVQKVLVAVNVAGEQTKSGVSERELEELLALASTSAGVECVGLMTMPPLVDDPDANRPHFAALRGLRDRCLPGGELSMGTTSDYVAAVEEGATLVRVGTAIFGERPPPLAA